MEKVIISILVASQISNSLNYGSEIFGISSNLTEAFKVLSKILEIPYVFILSYSVFGVNKQLGLFFDQVPTQHEYTGIKSYNFY